MHHSGFVNIIGRPNVGKSTLMNALVGERMSIVTPKSQTTRHRLIGLLSGDDFQIVFSDTPGWVRNPTYKMHEAMNGFVRSTFEDADMLLFVTEIGEEYPDDDALVLGMQNAKVPLFLLLNKTDQHTPEAVQEALAAWTARVEFTEVHPISALHKRGTAELLAAVRARLPEGPEYYPKDQLSDRPERFFVAEIIREKILLLYRDEIPYACEVVTDAFKEDPRKPLIRISVTIYIMREQQKIILIGAGGSGLKKLGIEARKALEAFLEKQVHLETHVKVRENWRDDERMLKYFGYES